MIDFANFLYKIIFSFFRLLGLLPRRWAIFLGNLLGTIWYGLDRQHRQIALQNITQAFGQEMSPRKIRGICRRGFCNLGQLVFEVGWFQRLRPEDCKRHVHFEGFSPEKVAQLRTGALVLTGHLGSWELMPIIAVMVRLSVSIVFRPLDFKPLDRFFNQSRSRFGAGLISKTNAMLKILRALKAGKDVAFLLDQNVGWRRGVFVDFFGRTACTSNGLALLALKTRLPVYPMFLVREGPGFKALLGEAIPLILTGDKEHEVALNTRQYNQALENVIRRYPDQWFWVHRRWKSRPKQHQTVWTDV